MLKNQIRLILACCFFSIVSFAVTVPARTRLYKKPVVTKRYILTTKKKLSVRGIAVKGKASWFKVKVQGRTGYVYLPSGARAGNKAKGKTGSQRGSGSVAAKIKGGSAAKGVRGATRGKASKGSSASRGSANTSSSSGVQRGGSSRGRATSYSSSSGSGPRRQTASSVTLRQNKNLQENSNEEFCSQCWYAKHGYDGPRSENTNRDISRGELAPGGTIPGGAGRPVVE